MRMHEGETYEEWRAREKAARRIPPTQDLDVSAYDFINYDNDTEVQWICRCGSDQLKVFYSCGNYRTYARCGSCGAQADIHDG